MSGWHLFVHHFDTVAVSLPSSLASHLPVLPFSASTTFRRFILFVIQENLFALCAKLRIINETYEFWQFKITRSISNVNCMTNYYQPFTHPVQWRICYLINPTTSLGNIAFPPTSSFGTFLRNSTGTMV